MSWKASTRVSVNFNVQVREHNGKVIFLRKLVRGGSDHSYGIQVAFHGRTPRNRNSSRPGNS